MPIRLNKYIASSGHCSRRKADELISSGEVLINNAVTKELGQKVDPHSDVVRIKNGPIIRPQTETILIALHKPKGYVCTKSDPFHTKTIYNLLPKQLSHLFPIGRLDKESEGLLLLTNNGDMANLMAHPRHQKLKIYQVEVRGEVMPKAIAKIAKGMHLKEYKTSPAMAKVLYLKKEENRTVLEVRLKEGKKHQIRNMFLFLGNPVKRLVRLSIGPYHLGTLKKGEWHRIPLNHAS